MAPTQRSKVRSSRSQIAQPPAQLAVVSLVQYSAGRTAERWRTDAESSFRVWATRVGLLDILSPGRISRLGFYNIPEQLHRFSVGGTGLLDIAELSVSVGHTRN